MWCIQWPLWLATIFKIQSTLAAMLCKILGQPNAEYLVFKSHLHLKSHTHAHTLIITNILLCEIHLKLTFELDDLNVYQTVIFNVIKMWRYYNDSKVDFNRNLFRLIIRIFFSLYVCVRIFILFNAMNYFICNYIEPDYGKLFYRNINVVLFLRRNSKTKKNRTIGKNINHPKSIPEIPLICPILMLCSIIQRYTCYLP